MSELVPGRFVPKIGVVATLTEACEITPEGELKIQVKAKEIKSEGTVELEEVGKPIEAGGDIVIVKKRVVFRS